MTPDEWTFIADNQRAMSLYRAILRVSNQSDANFGEAISALGMFTSRVFAQFPEEHRMEILDAWIDMLRREVAKSFQ